VPNFKLKLFVYFLAMGVLPLAAATWAVTRVQARTATRAANERLAAELRASLAAYRREIDAASAPALRLARSRTVARRLERAGRHTLFVDRSGAVLRRRPAHTATQAIAVVGPNGRIGTVDAVVALDVSLLERIRHGAGLPAGERLAIVDRGRLVAGDRAAGRARRAVRLPGTRSASLALLAPEGASETAARATTRDLLAALAAALLLAALVAYFEGRAIVRTIRSLVTSADAIARGRLDQRVAVRGHDELASLGHAFNTMAHELEAEQSRVRQVVSGFGAALAATHDVDELVRVIVETAVEATGAAGATFVGSDALLLGVGEFDDDTAERLELPVEGKGGRFGVLTLVGAEFGEESVATARSLVSQAVVALENEKLHRIVAQQAMTDTLTGLANRRRCEEALHAELAHVRRFGGSLAVVIADLDDFKRLNDTRGHAAGDAVLREFADLLRGTLRASDVAARWGGEEFVLLLRETGLGGAGELAERIRSALAARAILGADGARLAVTASFGVAAYDGSDENFHVLAAADDALYAAKRNGKNRTLRADQLTSRPSPLVVS